MSRKINKRKAIQAAKRNEAAAARIKHQRVGIIAHKPTVRSGLALLAALIRRSEKKDV